MTLPPALLFSPVQIKALGAVALLVLAGYGALGFLYMNKVHQLDLERLNYARREAQINAALVKQQAENRRIETTAATLLREAKDESDRIVEAQRVAHDDALRRLRDDRPRAALKPAATAPAECVSYAAPPARLSIEDATFLIDFAAEADRVAAQLRDAQRYIEAVNRAFGAPQP